MGMNLLSHLRMARRLLAPYGGGQGGVKSIAFLFGNIRPDIMGGFLVLPHTPAARAEIINRKIEKCIADMQTGQRGGIYTNYRLGVICHFLADFFCYAHNDWAQLTSKDHFTYEMQLNRALKQADYEKDSIPLPAGDVHSIIQSIWQAHKQYASLTPNPLQDIEYTGDVCAYLLSSARYLAHCGGYAPFEETPIPAYA